MFSLACCKHNFGDEVSTHLQASNWFLIIHLSFAMSDKGWTDGEIGIGYIKDFDKQTKTKANGKTRLLLLDGHNSHFTLESIQSTITANIVVFCYPEHSTHVLQGLDVVAFAASNKVWSRKHTE